MIIHRHFSLCFILLFGISISSLAQDLVYDSSATSECKPRPFKPLYGGGLLKGQKPSYEPIQINKWVTITAPSYKLPNLVPGVYYSFSSWVKIMGAESALIWANLGSLQNCEATVLAKRGCWTFLKGGIFLTQPLNTSTLYFEALGAKGINIDVASASLQPFTEEQWRENQQAVINRERKRDTTITVTDQKGIPLQGAKVKVEQISSGFPFGVAISSMITQNSHYQEWFKKRFNAAVFENELKWPSNEPRPGVVNYNISDQMVDFVKKNKIMTRGHNVVWQDPNFAPSWTRNLTGPEMQQAVDRRVNSVVDRYKNKFIHWDVNNELLHYDFYERKLENPNASLDFYKKVQEKDPNATLFINDFKVVEQCGNTTNVDSFVAKIKEFQANGIAKPGIGLEGHFDIPNPPFMRAVMDKLATLKVPMWLTEVDISIKYSKEEQAMYLEKVLREGFSHPAINGIIIWAGITPKGCWNMCLTDLQFNNTVVGDVVDKLLKEWQTGTLTGVTNNQGSFEFSGFFRNIQCHS
ncbi:endo-1,4-beta-xylanase 5-like [Ipomoea triloba]|uniref:endo-1,4-beta-xylanase 5-like n=1 Tax=Ipomoea triloba TaxID=35885 RepID=UPI00125D178D|nr:endo-1,4-beta-xylanase 5-like [Ipomoea triloba]